MYILIGYVMLSFLATTIIVKIWPHNFEKRSEDDIPPAFLFFVTMVLWPLVAAFWVLAGPVKVIDMYVTYLTKRKK